MKKSMEIRVADWSEYAEGSGSAAASCSHAAENSVSRPKLTRISASYSVSTNGELDFYGLTKVGPLDLTDEDVLDLSTDKFTLANHGLSNNDQVMLHMQGGTAPTGLTDKNVYYAVGVSGDDFQLESTVGGGAIDMSGTQANFGTDALLLNLSKSWHVYDNFGISFDSPLEGDPDTVLVAKLAAGAGSSSTIGKIDMEGYTT